MERQKVDSTRPFAVITGASSGIGYELAKVFSENGFDLLIAAEDARIVKAATEISQAGAGLVEPLQVDLASEVGVNQLYGKISSMGRELEALCVNAGVGSGGEFSQTSLEKEENLIRLNILSVVRLTKKVLKDMLAAGHGRILFTSSIAAETPGPYEAVYAASKAFVQSFAEALQYENKDKGIVITALQPGATDTEFFERADMQNTKVGHAEKDDPAKVARQGFEALMAGKDHVVAGSLMNKVNVAGSKLISEQQGAKMQARETKPDSLH